MTPTADELHDRYYVQRMSQRDMASIYGVSLRTVQNWMALRGVKAQRNRRAKGEKCWQWKGSNASYSAFHKRLDRLYGTPSKCSKCGTTDPDRVYEWANLTGNYSELSDYARMCRQCHRRHDRWAGKMVEPRKRQREERAKNNAGRLQRLAERVFRWRTQRGLSLASASALCGMSASYLCEIENQRTPISEKAMSRLEDFIDQQEAHEGESR